MLLASGYSEEEVAERFKGLGLNGFIQKPFNLNRLTEVVQQLLGKSSFRAATSLTEKTV